MLLSEGRIYSALLFLLMHSLQTPGPSKASNIPATSIASSNSKNITLLPSDVITTETKLNITVHLGSPSSSPVTYHFKPGDGWTLITFKNSINYQYRKPGLYHMKVTIEFSTNEKQNLSNDILVFDSTLIRESKCQVEIEPTSTESSDRTSISNCSTNFLRVSVRLSSCFGKGSLSFNTVGSVVGVSTSFYKKLFTVSSHSYERNFTLTKELNGCSDIFASLEMQTPKGNMLFKKAITLNSCKVSQSMIQSNGRTYSLSTVKPTQSHLYSRSMERSKTYEPSTTFLVMDRVSFTISSDTKNPIKTTSNKPVINISYSSLDNTDFSSVLYSSEMLYSDSLHITSTASAASIRIFAGIAPTASFLGHQTSSPISTNIEHSASSTSNRSISSIGDFSLDTFLNFKDLRISKTKYTPSLFFNVTENIVVSSSIPTGILPTPVMTDFNNLTIMANYSSDAAFTSTTSTEKPKNFETLSTNQSAGMKNNGIMSSTKSATNTASSSVNGIVLACLIMVFLFMIIATLIAHKGDRQICKPATDLTNEDEDIIYDLQFYLGECLDKTSHCSIQCTLYGSHGEVGPTELSSSAESHFKEKGIIKFFLSTTKDIGDIVIININCLNMESNSDWFLRTIELKKVIKGSNFQLRKAASKSKIFYCYSWFAPTLHASSVIQNFEIAKSKEDRRFVRHLYVNLRELLLDKHILTSWYRSHRPDRLSRVYRSCILSTAILAYLLYSTIYVHVNHIDDHHDPSHGFRVGFVKLSKSTVSAAVISAFTGYGLAILAAFIVLYFKFQSSGIDIKLAKRRSSNKVLKQNESSKEPTDSKNAASTPRKINYINSGYKGSTELFGTPKTPNSGSSDALWGIATANNNFIEIHNKKEPSARSSPVHNNCLSQGSRLVHKEEEKTDSKNTNILNGEEQTCNKPSVQNAEPLLNALKANEEQHTHITTENPESSKFKNNLGESDTPQIIHESNGWLSSDVRVDIKEQDVKISLEPDDDTDVNSNRPKSRDMKSTSDGTQSRNEQVSWPYNNNKSTLYRRNNPVNRLKYRLQSSNLETKSRQLNKFQVNDNLWSSIIWFPYVILIAVTFFYTLIASARWDHHDTNHWMSLSVLGFFFLTVILDTLRVIVYVIFITLQERQERMKIKKTRCMSNYSGILTAKKKAELYRTSHLKNLEGKSKILDEHRRLRSKLKDVIIYGLFVAILIFLTKWTVSSSSILMFRTLQKTLMAKKLRPVQDEGFGLFWEWIHLVLPPLLNLTLRDDTDKGLYLIHGTVHLMQKRILKGKCKVVEPMDKVVHECNVNYEPEFEDKGNYLKGWIRNQANKSNRSGNSLSTPWQYDSSYHYQHNDVRFKSTLSYSNGAYVVRLNASNYKTILNELESNNWIDKYSSLIAVEAFIYDPSVNLLSPTIMALEFDASTYIFKTERFYNFLMFFEVTTGHEIAQFFEFLFIVFNMYFLVAIFRRKQRTSRTWVSGWLLIQIIVIVLSFTVSGLFSIKTYQASITGHRLAKDSKREDSLHIVSFYQQVLEHVLTLLNFFALALFLKPLFTLGMFDDMYLALVMSFSNLKGIAIESFILLFAFTTWAHFIYVTKSSSFATMDKAFPNLIDMLIMPDNFIELTGKDASSRLLYFVYCSVMTFLVTNIFISIIEQSYQASHRVYDGEKRVKLVSFVKTTMTDEFAKKVAIAARKIRWRRRKGRRFPTFGKRHETNHHYKVTETNLSIEELDDSGIGSQHSTEIQSDIDHSECVDCQGDKELETAVVEDLLKRLDQSVSIASKKVLIQAKNDFREDFILLSEMRQHMQRMMTGEASPAHDLKLQYERYKAKPNYLKLENFYGKMKIEETTI